MATIPDALAIAVQHHQAGRLAAAEQIYRRVLAVDPNHVDVLHFLGVIANQTGKHELAVEYLERAIALRGDDATFHNNLGEAYRALHRTAEAAASYRRALKLKPDFAEAYYNLGGMSADQGELREAVAFYRRALELQPDFAEAHYNLGNVLADQGEPGEAVATYRRALEFKPGYVEAHNNLGTAFLRQRKLGEAAACYRRALQLKPDFAEAHLGLAAFHLLHGDLQPGWPEYEWRWLTKQSALRPFQQPPWDGSSLVGKTILLHAEQGLGDTIQFVRYAPLVKRLGATVILECQQPLVPLLAVCPGIDRLIGCGDHLPAFDVHLPLLSVPRVLKTCLANIPADVPYLSAKAESIECWRQALAGAPGFKVGINWRGRPGPGNWTRRDVPLRLFASLAEIPTVRLVSLQKGAGPTEEQPAASQLSLWEPGPELDQNGDFTDTAGIMKNLDLVITSDTAVPHVAGALGVPVWVALPFVPDWRWMLDRGDSPWYPTMRLFRQKEPGDWAGVFSEIAAALRQRLSIT